MRLIHLPLISSVVWILYCMYVYIIYSFEKIFYYSYIVIHIPAKFLTNSIFPIFSMVCSGISEASH